MQTDRWPDGLCELNDCRELDGSGELDKLDGPSDGLVDTASLS